MAILHHGTTRIRAERIILSGPDPNFIEPGGARSEGFSTSLAAGPFPLGKPAEYALAKSKIFPDEGGPVIVEVEVPDEIVSIAVSPWFPLSQGVVQFDEGAGLTELRDAWPTLSKQIIAVGEA